MASVSPESSVHYPSAGLFRRLAALLYDGFLVAGILWLLGTVFNFLFGEREVQNSLLLSNLLFGCMVSAVAAFYVGFWSISGQTLGMISWRLRVQGDDGRLLSPGRCLLRFVLAWPSFFLLGIGYFWIYFDKNGDALHDRLSRSHVVLLPKDYAPFK